MTPVLACLERLAPHVARDRIAITGSAVILDHKLEILTGVSATRPVDPKHASDARALAAQLGRAVAPIDRCACERRRGFPTVPTGASARPEWDGA